MKEQKEKSLTWKTRHSVANLYNLGDGERFPTETDYTIHHVLYMAALWQRCTIQELILLFVTVSNI